MGPYESEQPIHLIWRDRLEVMKQLFANPTSDDAWEIQNQLPEGAAIILIIAASDKTPVTKHMGGLEMHPLFLTIGNIQGNIHMKATSHAWRCTAFMPIPTFIVNSDFKTLLWSHLWHKCMDLVCSNLKVAARVGEYMIDPSARLCYCFTPLISHIADLPKQSMIACITKNSSPITTATQKEFGDETPHPPWNGIDTYTCIQQLCTRVDPWDLVVFLREAKKFCLSGIMGHKLDVWFKSHHKRTGVRHFSGGVSYVNQMTGQEHRDIQHTIVLTLWDMASPGFIRAVQAMIDFIYLAQNPLHTESSIASMTQALRDFHDNKQAILDAEARQGKSGTKDNFFIPKLELMQSFARAISHVADMSEQLLITHCKHPFECTSCQRDFDPLINAVIMEDEEVASTETDPAFAWVSNANQAAQLHLQALHPIHNHFLKGILSDNARIAFNVTVKADCSHLNVSQLQSLYNISDFYHALHLYATRNGCILPGQLSFNTWMKFCIQLHSTFHACRIMLSQQIHAEPPSSNFPRGNCDVVLFNQRVDGGNDGSHVAQVQTIFQPTLPKGSRAQVAECLSQPLVYIQLFDFVVPGPKPSTGMWMSERVIRHGCIIPLTDVMHAVEIIPVYQGPLGKDVNSRNSLEVFDKYFLNNFADKELYHSLSVISDN
ncbi:hypothetical protein BDR03DRAFT_932634 [Suillus americanus]|nr:hypothetical protein BDR03DRAFT_932634 [Suillus americanus]